MEIWVLGKLHLLTNYEPLFDGTLGAWKTAPVIFELKEGAKPYHGRAFPIPKVHKATIMKEIKRVCELGVLEWQPLTEWAAPSFIQPKKNKTVRFLTDFRELNKRLIRKPFPLPKMSTVLRELESFTFATALDLNMGYYHKTCCPGTILKLNLAEDVIEKVFRSCTDLQEQK